eukprot:scaffold91958_cov48-Phaeocystis_antarctica.AAC.2
MERARRRGGGGGGGGDGGGRGGGLPRHGRDLGDKRARLRGGVVRHAPVAAPGAGAQQVQPLGLGLLERLGGGHGRVAGVPGRGRYFSELMDVRAGSFALALSQSEPRIAQGRDGSGAALVACVAERRLLDVVEEAKVLAPATTAAGTGLEGLAAVRQVDDSFVAAIGAGHPHELEALRRRHGDGLLGRLRTQSGLRRRCKAAQVLVLAVAAGCGLVRLRFARLEVDALVTALRSGCEYQVQTLALRRLECRPLPFLQAGILSGGLEPHETVAERLAQRLNASLAPPRALLLRGICVSLWLLMPFVSVYERDVLDLPPWP